MKKYLNFLLILLVIPSLGKAGDPIFTQVNSVPIFYNPAFAGSIDKARLAFNYRNQWPGLAYSRVTATGSFDQFVPALRGGLGGQFYYDQEGLITNLNFGLVYSPKFRVGENWGLAPALKLGGQYTLLDRENLVTPNPDDPAFDKFPLFHPEVSVGFLANTRKFYIGMNADHLVPGGWSSLRLVLHSGYTFRKEDESKFSFSPSLYLMSQPSGTLGLPLTMALATVRYQWLFAGAGYISSSAIPIMLGAEWKGVRIGFSFYLDFSIMGQQDNTPLGGFESALRYQYSPAYAR